MFRQYAVADADLTEDMIPHVGERWDSAMTRFALSFDGYAHTMQEPGTVPVARLAGFARPVVTAFARDGALPLFLSLGDLRACFFWEQRRSRYAVKVEIAGKQRDYLRALLDAIRVEIIARRGG